MIHAIVHTITTIAYALIFVIAFAAAITPDFETRKFTYVATLSYRLLFLAVAVIAAVGLWG